MRATRVLVVQLARLGDLVQTWPLLRRLRQQNPDGSLELITDQRLNPLVKLGPRVEAGWTLDFGDVVRLAGQDLPAAYGRLSALAAGLQHRRYDLVYNLNFSRISLLLSYLVGQEIRGYRPVRGGREFVRDPWLAWVYALVHARRVNRLHLSDVFRHLAPAVPQEAGPPPVRRKAGEPVVALQVATRHPRRTWPLKAFTRLTDILVQRLGARVWLLGTKEERPLGEQLKKSLTLAHRDRVLNLQGQTHLPELAALLKEVHLLISGDTGTLHLAAALGTATLGVFLGPASCFETGPYGDGHYVCQAEPDCHPCSESGEGCLEPVCRDLIPPEGVAALAIAILVKGEVTDRPPFPAGTRVYRSFRDYLGVNYLPLGSPWRPLDLVGEAYRRTGARLLGLTGLTFPPLAPFQGKRDDLERLLKALENGSPKAMPSPPPEVLAPLLAYQAEWRRQQAQEGASLWEAGGFETIKNEFRDTLEEMMERLP